MHLLGCEHSGPVRLADRHRTVALAVIALTLAFVIAGLLPMVGAHGLSGLGKGRLAPANAGTPPTIYSFSDFPNTIFEGSGTSLSVSASSAFFNPLAYNYAGLPAGCTSLNTSFLFCTPAVAGSFNVSVTVTDTGTLGVARAYTLLYVNPVVNESFFATNNYAITPALVNFTEFGLSFGTPWSVALGSDAQSGTTGTLSFLEMGGTYSYTINPVPGYTASPAFGSVTLSYSLVTVFVSFIQNPLTFTETGLASNTPWDVTVNGLTENTIAPFTLTFYEPEALVDYSVGLISGYSASPASGSTFVFGPTSVPITFTNATTFSAYNATFAESTLPFGQFWSVDLNGTVYGGTSSPFLIAEPNGTYNYTIPPVAGFVASPSSGTVTIAGAAPTPVVITYSAAPTSPVLFNETGLPSGTTWSVAVNGTIQTGTSASLSFALSNGSYMYSVGGSALSSVPGYVVAPQNGLFTVTGSGTTFLPTYSLVSTLSSQDSACTSINSPPFYQNFCYPEAQTPTLLTLSNGDIALASELYTNTTANTCGGAPAATVARIGFSLSSSGGNGFGPSLTLGNDTCAYLDAIDPAFATNGTSVYGAFVEENSTQFASNYVARGSDALGFVRSTDGGLTFAPAVTLNAAGNIARPTVATFGSSVYVVYEDIASSATPNPGGYLPISLMFIYSADGGLTWSAPTALPGMNAAEQFTAMSPSLAVNQTGTVAVAYATNRSCLLAVSGGGCGAYGDSIVVTTSSSNGSVWVGPTILAGHAGETLCYTGSCYAGFFQATPQVTAAYSPDGQSLYVAYAATYDQGAGSGSTNFNHSGIFAVEDTGGTLSSAAVVAPTGAIAVRAYNPGLGVSSQGAYVTYLEANESSGTLAFANSLSQWVSHSPLGASASWSPPVTIFINSFISGGSVNGTRTSFPGFSSSVAFDATGSPVVAFAWPEPSTTTTARSPSYYYVNTTFPTLLVTGTLALPGAANTVSITFSEAGLPSGRPWTFTISGVTYQLTTPSIEVTNIPVGASVMVGASYQPGFWEVVSGQFPASLQTFTFSGSSTFSFEVWEGLEFHTIPTGIFPWLLNVCCDYYDVVQAQMLYSPFGAYASAQWEQYSYNYPPVAYSTISYFGYSYTTSFFESWYNSCFNSLCGYTTPWYFPLGSEVKLVLPEFAFTQLAPVYIAGTGIGSYTGGLTSPYCYGYYFCQLDSGIITMGGPINETLWLGNAPINLVGNVSFSATGIPSTSQYSATLDSTTLVGTAAAPAEAYNVSPGAHTVSHVWATSTLPGWEYFGTVAGPNPFVTPLVSGVSLDFSALVNLTAAAGVVTFHATNLTTGTAWSITFNQTTYSSTTPWINVTTRPGTFVLSPDNAVNPNGTAGYVPARGTQNISVLPGRTYTLTYVPAYEVELVATSGGFVSANTGADQNIITFLQAAGSIVQLHAVTSSGYSFAGWSGTGPGAYSGTQASPSITVGGPIVESASFLPLPGARFNLTFIAAGLPTGTWWTVELNHVGYSSDVGSLSIGHLYPWSVTPAGRYTLSAPVVYLNSTDLTRFVAVAPPPIVGTNGSATPPVVISYLTDYYLQVTTAGGGSAVATSGNQPLSTPAFVAQATPITLTALPNPGYTFAGWQGSGAGSYTGPNVSAPISMNAPIREVAVFAPIVPPPPATYTLTVVLDTSLATGTIWSLTLGGVGYTASGSTLTISGLAPGNYGMLVGTVNSPDGLTQYRATPTDPVAYTVSGNAMVHIALEPYYWVQVSSTTGGTVSPGSGYYAANSILYLVAAASTGYSFAQWSGVTSGGYSGTNSTASIIVTEPITEVADFHAAAGPALAASIWSNPGTWVGIAAAGLIVGLAVGMVVARYGLRDRPNPASAPAGPPSGGNV